MLCEPWFSLPWLHSTFSLHLSVEVGSLQGGCAGGWEGVEGRQWCWRPDWSAEWEAGRMQALPTLAEDGERMPFADQKTDFRPDTFQPASHQGEQIQVSEEGKEDSG